MPFFNLILIKYPKRERSETLLNENESYFERNRMKKKRERSGRLSFAMCEWPR